MTKADLINAIAEKAEFSKKDSEKALNAVISSIVGFGTFEVRQRDAKEAINPRTKEKIQIPAKKAPAFKAGTALKDVVNK